VEATWADGNVAEDMHEGEWRFGLFEQRRVGALSRGFLLAIVFFCVLCFLLSCFPIGEQ
jgi:hypothetical protein